MPTYRYRCARCEETFERVPWVAGAGRRPAASAVPPWSIWAPEC